MLLLALAGGAPAAETRSGQTVRVDGAVQDDLFVAGATVDVPAGIGGDLFAAAARLTVGGPVAGDLVAAGATVTVAGPVAEDAILGALTARLEAPVTGKLIAAAAEVVTARSAPVGGSALINAGRVRLEGDIAGDALVNAGEVVIAGSIGGTLRIAAGRIEFRPGARIGGDILYGGVDRLEVPPGVTVGGRTVASGAGYAGSLDSLALGALAWGAGLFLLGMVLYLAFPGFVSAAAGQVVRGPAGTLAIGVATVLLAPVLAALLMFTLIGFPIALLLLFGYLAALTMGAALAGFGVVALVRPAWLGPVTGRASAAARYAVFTLALVLGSLVPVAGPWLLFFAVALGVGGAARITLRGQ